MQKRDKTDYLIITVGVIGIILGLISSIYSIIAGDIEFIFDGFFSAGIICFVLYLYREIDIKPSVLLFGLMIIVAHHLRLYGTFYFRIAFDHWIHTASGIFLGIVFYRYFSKTIKNKAAIIALSILISAGFGAIFEILEFVGYLFVGATGGQGILYYGLSDSLEYNNLGWDLVCNTLGAVLGSLVLLIKDWIWKK
jgi:hypothetical protein